MDKFVPGKTSMLLGTAAWQAPGSLSAREFKAGDFFLGYANGKAAGVNDDRHTSVTGTTRGGKGTSVIVQNLLMWQGSVTVIDPKGENAMVTARRRGKGSRFSSGMGQEVRILDPFDTVKTVFDDFKDLKACFNPLDFLSAGREESVDDAARIAEALIVSEKSNDPFWEDSARIVLKGIILHVATWANLSPEERNLNTVRKFIMQGDDKAHKLALLAAADPKKVPSPFRMLYASMKRNQAFGGVVCNVGTMMDEMAKDSPRTLASYLQVVRTNTEFMDSPAMKRILARSDFSLDELKKTLKGRVFTSVSLKDLLKRTTAG